MKRDLGQRTAEGIHDTKFRRLQRHSLVGEIVAEYFPRKECCMLSLVKACFTDSILSLTLYIFPPKH
jgi:hypothetical protein